MLSFSVTFNFKINDTKGRSDSNYPGDEQQIMLSKVFQRQITGKRTKMPMMACNSLLTLHHRTNLSKLETFADDKLMGAKILELLLDHML